MYPQCNKTWPCYNAATGWRFRSVVQSCKRLRWSSLSKYAEKLERLSIAFTGKNDKEILNVLNGCKKLRMVKIRNYTYFKLTDLWYFLVSRLNEWNWFISFIQVLSFCSLQLVFLSKIFRVKSEILNWNSNFIGFSLEIVTDIKFSKYEW
jgi:hypothetical protein